MASNLDWVPQANMDAMSRQSEINEWTYQNKMETLFILQLVFLGLLFVSLVGILGRMGVVNRMYMWYIAFFFGVVLFLFWMVKAGYTKEVRDRRFWSKRTFEGDFQTRPAISDEAVAAVAQQQALACQA